MKFAIQNKMDGRKNIKTIKTKKYKLHLDLNTQRISQINSQLGMDSIYLFFMIPFLKNIISSNFSYLHSCFDISLFAKRLLYQRVFCGQQKCLCMMNLIVQWTSFVIYMFKLILQLNVNNFNCSLFSHHGMKEYL